LLSLLALLCWSQTSRGAENQPEASGFRVAVLPFPAMAVGPEATKGLRLRLAENIGDRFDIVVVPFTRANKAVTKQCGGPKNWWDCLAKDENLMAIGKHLQAQTVVTGRLAAMGKKSVLKLKLTEMATGRVSAEVLELPPGGEEEAIGRSLIFHERAFPGREAKQWHQKWQSWSIVGAGVAVLAGAIVLGLTLSSPDGQRDYDFHRTLP